MMNDGIVLPGDSISAPEDAKVLRLGQGLVLGCKKEKEEEEDEIKAVRAGKLIIKKPIGKEEEGSSSLYIESSTKRYIPSCNDLVLGIVHSKVSTGSDTGGYRVDLSNRELTKTLSQIIGIQNQIENGKIIKEIPPKQINFNVPTYIESTAILDGLAFNNAHKKNRPILNPGSIVYARIIGKIDKYCDVNITCIESSSSNKNNNKKIGLGQLKSTSASYLIDVGISITRRLLSTPKDNVNNLLMILGSRLSFEIIIGANGRVWINATATGDDAAGNKGKKKSQSRGGQQEEEEEDDDAMDVDVDVDDETNMQELKQNTTTVLVVSEIIRQSQSLITRQQIINRMDQLIALYS